MERFTHGWREFKLLFTPPLIGIYPREINICPHKGTKMFTVAFHKGQAENITH